MFTVLGFASVNRGFLGVTINFQYLIPLVQSLSIQYCLMKMSIMHNMNQFFYSSTLIVLCLIWQFLIEIDNTSMLNLGNF